MIQQTVTFYFKPPLNEQAQMNVYLQNLIAQGVEFMLYFDEVSRTAKVIY